MVAVARAVETVAGRKEEVGTALEVLVPEAAAGTALDLGAVALTAVEAKAGATGVSSGLAEVEGMAQAA